MWLKSLRSSFGKIVIPGLLAANCCLLLRPIQGQPVPLVVEPPKVQVSAGMYDSTTDFRVRLQADMKRFEEEEKRLTRLVHVRMLECQGLTGVRRVFLNKPMKVAVTSEEDDLIRAAGQLRVVDCVDLLLNRITYQSLSYSDFGEIGGVGGAGGGLGGIGRGLGGVGGAIQQVVSPYRSLVQIGPPAADRAIERLSQEADLKTRERIASLVKDVYGKHSVEKFQNLRERQTVLNADAAARIDEAIAYLEKARQDN